MYAFSTVMKHCCRLPELRELRLTGASPPAGPQLSPKLTSLMINGLSIDQVRAMAPNSLKRPHVCQQVEYMDESMDAAHAFSLAALL